MAARRERRLKIQERPTAHRQVALTVASGANEAPSPPPKRVAVPLCITFFYHGHCVVCTPLYDDAGVLQNVTWNCPRCGQRQQFETTSVTAFLLPNGHPHVNGIVRCTGGGCALALHINNGQAEDCRGAC